MRQPDKVVKDNETIRQLLPNCCLGVFDHIVGLAFKGLTKRIKVTRRYSRRVFRTLLNIYDGVFCDNN